MQHTNMHVHLRTQHHTHTCTHNTMCMQNGSSSLYIASQNGHDRIAEMLLRAGATVDTQNKVICPSVTCSVSTVIHCTLRTPHNIPGNIKFREDIQQKTSADMHGRTNSFVHCKHVHLVVGGHTLD